MASRAEEDFVVQSHRKRQRPIPISLAKASLRIRLEAYYSLIAPETLVNRPEWLGKFDQIYEKYGGTHEGERKLASKLAKKYGTNVRLLLAKSGEPLDVHRAASFLDIQKDEEWYHLNEHQVGSGNLNVQSTVFDPVALLRAPREIVYSTNPWMKESGMILDNIDKFAPYLPADDPQYRDIKLKRGRETEERKERPSATSKRPKTIHPFDAIATRLDSGPISVLHKLRKKRVTIVVRYVNAIRGSLTGTLIAFDKHMNMILKDVVEVYSPRPVDYDSKDKSNLEIEMERRSHMDSMMTMDNSRKDEDMGQQSGDCKIPHLSGNSSKVKIREMKQMLVRGDMVVSAYEAPRENTCINQDLQTE